MGAQKSNLIYDFIPRSAGSLDGFSRPVDYGGTNEFRRGLTALWCILGTWEFSVNARDWRRDALTPMKRAFAIHITEVEEVIRRARFNSFPLKGPWSPATIGERMRVLFDISPLRQLRRARARNEIVFPEGSFDYVFVTLRARAARVNVIINSLTRILQKRVQWLIYATLMAKREIKTHDAKTVSRPLNVDTWHALPRRI